jgi:glycosyltransferase involved in cell wall biosynthesis
MKIICVMPVRNEDWILGLSARAVLRWVDELVILDHCSTDRSREIEMEIAGEFPDRITVLTEDNPEWQEMRHRQALLTEARQRGATHIAIVDADEVLTGNLLPDIRSMVGKCGVGITMQLFWQCLRGSINKVHTDGVWGTAEVSMAFRDEERCYWASRSGYDFHHRQPMGRPFFPHNPIRRTGGGLMHLQFVSDRRLRAKQYAYQLTERLRWPNREPIKVVRERYSLAVYNGVGLADVPKAWWEPYADLMKYMDVDAEPWQIELCRKIIAENPGIEVGLDNFGVEVACTR